MDLAKKRPEIVVTWPTHAFVTFVTGQSLHWTLYQYINALKWKLII